MPSPTDTTDRRIYSIEYHHGGKDYIDEVGKPNDISGERVLVILESNAYLVCTGSRGVVRGEPILVGKEEARSVVDFDPAE